MKIVIQCAATKRPEAGYWRRADGRRVLFVAHPEVAPANGRDVLARPDDDAGDGRSYRDHLVAYNRQPDNPLRLSEAWRLYAHPAYEVLHKKFGAENLFILSAGWGLVRSDYRLPKYDITFSQAGGALKKRMKSDRYRDFAQLAEDKGEEVHFIGGKDYIPLFVALTTPTKNRVVHYNSERTPNASGCRLKRYETKTRTNWHYELAARFCNGSQTLNNPGA